MKNSVSFKNLPISMTKFQNYFLVFVNKYLYLGRANGGSPYSRYPGYPANPSDNDGGYPNYPSGK